MNELLKINGLFGIVTVEDQTMDNGNIVYMVDGEKVMAESQEGKAAAIDHDDIEMKARIILVGFSHGFAKGRTV